jgi:hypothetical protein
MSVTLSTSGNPALDLKSNFIVKYGSYAQPYDALDATGSQKFNTLWPYMITVISFFLMIFCFTYGKEEIDPKTNQPIEKTPMKKMLTNLGFLLLLCTIAGSGWGFYLYLMVYLPQKTKWFNSLPDQAKASVGMMYTLDSLNSSNSNQQSTTIKFS